MPVYTIRPLSKNLEKTLGTQTVEAREAACHFPNKIFLVEEVLEAAASYPDEALRRDAIKDAIAWVRHLAEIALNLGKTPEITGRDLDSLKNYAWWLKPNGARRQI